MMPSPPQSRTLLQQAIRIIGVIQGLIACAVLVSFLFYVWDSYRWNYYYSSNYDFIAAFFSSLMSLGIIVIVLIQRRAIVNPELNFHFEAAKSTLATILWLWLMIDSAFVDRSDPYYTPPSTPNRLLKASLAVIILILVYIPTLEFAWRDRKNHRENNNNSDATPSAESDLETAPLLSNAE